LSLQTPWFYALLMMYGFGALAFQNRRWGSAWVFSVLGAYCLATALGRARMLRILLTASSDRIIFNFYPIRDHDFFRWILDRFLMKSLLIWGVAAIGYAAFSGFEVKWIGSILGFATLEWLVTVCLILLLARLSWQPPSWLTVGLYCAVAVPFFSPSTARRIFPVISLLPAGWVNSFYLSFSPGGRSYVMLVAAIIGTAVVAGWLALLLRASLYPVPANSAEALEDATRILRQSVEEAEEADAGAEDEPLDVRAAPEWQRQRLTFLKTQYADFVHSHDWRARLDWSHLSWLERLVGCWLSESEKNIAEFLLGGLPPQWGSQWRISIIAAAVASALLIFPASSYTTTAAILSIVISAATGVPIAGGAWAATSGVYVSGKLCPLLAGYPLSYRSSSIVMAKINLVRAFTWSPIGFLLGAIIGWRDYGSSLQGVWVVLNLLLFWVAVIPFLAAGHFSKRTNDTTNLRPWAAALLFMVTIPFFVIVLVPVLILCFAAPRPFPLAAPVVLGLVAIGCWRLYGWYYENRRVDVLTEPRR
jgi:hypothetical protein